MTREANMHERAEMVRSMDRLVRAINNEEYLMSWLMNGVADGDITGRETDEDLEYYCDDDNYGYLMGLFLRLMARANKDGGLYSDEVLSQ